MKKNMLMMFGAMVFAMGGNTARAVVVTNGGSYLEVGPSLTNKGKDFGTSVYLNTTLKVGETWTVTPETAVGFTFTSKGKSAINADLVYLRFLIGGPVVKKWSEKTSFKLEYRVTPGLNAGFQQAGAYGSLAVRPVYVADLGHNFGVMVRGLTQVVLQRNGYQLYRPVNGKWEGAKGNGLFTFAPEVSFSYDINDKWGLSTYWSPSFVVNGPAKGADDATLTKLLGHQQAVSYSVNDALSVAVKATEDNIPLGKGFKLFDAKKLSYGLEVGYKF